MLTLRPGWFAEAHAGYGWQKRGGGGAAKTNCEAWRQMRDWIETAVCSDWRGKK